MIAIVDYGLGNLTSVAGAVERLGFEPQVTADPRALAQADKLILPGVGAFGDGMTKLRERGLDAALEPYETPYSQEPELEAEQGASPQ